MLMAPAAPAPNEIQKIDNTNINGCILTGAKQRPHSEVKTANNITLGFKRAM
jgi:hypothetical protein